MRHQLTLIHVDVLMVFIRVSLVSGDKQSLSMHADLPICPSVAMPYTRNKVFTVDELFSCVDFFI